MATSKNEQAKRPVLAFRIAPELRAALDILAKAERRTLNAYVNLVLEDHVAAAKKPPKGKTK